MAKERAPQRADEGVPEPLDLGEVTLSSNGHNPRVKAKDAAVGQTLTFTAENGVTYDGVVAALEDGYAVLDRVTPRN